jgi:hypothetical protein
MFDPLTISANWLVLVLREYFVDQKKQKNLKIKNESATNEEENQL